MVSSLSEQSHQFYSPSWLYSKQNHLSGLEEPGPLQHRAKSQQLNIFGDVLFAKQEKPYYLEGPNRQMPKIIECFLQNDLKIRIHGPLSQQEYD